MFKNFLKIAFRNIVRNKGYSLFIIVGLAVGLALFILMSLFADHEFGYDRFHKNGDRIFALVEEFHSSSEGAHHTGRISASILLETCRCDSSLTRALTTRPQSGTWVS